MLKTLLPIHRKSTLKIVLSSLIAIANIDLTRQCIAEEIAGEIAEEINPKSFVIVVKKHKNNKKLERKTLRHIFMGTNTNSHYTTVHLPAGHPLRVTFNTKVIGLTESRIQAYWAQLKFTGRGKPPKEMKSIEEIVSHLKKTPYVAAYFPADRKIPTGLEVIFP